MSTTRAELFVKMALNKAKVKNNKKCRNSKLKNRPLPPVFFNDNDENVLTTVDIDFKINKFLCDVDNYTQKSFENTEYRKKEKLDSNVIVEPDPVPQEVPYTYIKNDSCNLSVITIATSCKSSVKCDVEEKIKYYSIPLNNNVEDVKEHFQEISYDIDHIVVQSVNEYNIVALDSNSSLPSVVEDNIEYNNFCNALDYDGEDVNEYLEETYNDVEHTVVPEENQNIIDPTDSHSSIPTVEHSTSYDTDQTSITKDGTELSIDISSPSSILIQKLKRKHNSDNWKQNIIKRKRNFGEAYTNFKGKEFNEKKIGLSCTKCLYNCSINISEIERKIIFNKFWNLGDINARRNFIANSSKKIERKRTTATKSRSNNREYFFNLNDTNIRVCQRFFMTTLSISNRTIKTVYDKLKDGIITKDKRGHHKSHKRVNLKVKQRMYQHINSIPRVESHYLRAQTTREYIQSGKSLSDLHRDYVKLSISNNEEYGNYTMYRRIFNNEFNISFFTPKKDQCALCTESRNIFEEDGDKIKYEARIEHHLKEKELAREIKNNFKNQAQQGLCSAIVFDLQAVISTPMGDVSTFYYLSKLSVYNFTIFNLDNHQGHCYVWHEGESKRGVNEIASCIYKYMCSEVIDNKPLVMFSDNCSGQNKNKFMASLMLYAVQKLEIPSITHYFLVTGHTQNEGDSMHSNIEKEIKKQLKSGPIYVPAQVVSAIKASKKSKTAYQVEEVGYENFYDIKDLQSVIGTNFKYDTNKGKISWKKLAVIEVRKDEPFVLYIKENLNDSAYKKIMVNKPSQRKLRKLKNFKLKPLNVKPVSIASNKFNGLMGLCQKNLILPKYHGFYKSLLCNE